MSYDAIKEGITDLMQGIGFQESEFSAIESIPSHEMGKVFFLTPLSGSNDGDNDETLSDRIYDEQVWEIKVPFQKSQQSHKVQSDEVNRARDLIVKTMDKPANWEGYVRIQKFLEWNITDEKSFYLLTVRLKVVDTIIY